MVICLSVLKDVLTPELVERCRSLLLAANDDLRKHGRVGREGFYSKEMQNLGRFSPLFLRFCNRKMH